MSTQSPGNEPSGAASARAAADPKELQAAYEEMRQFAYAVSHDLREPLRMVSSYTQLLGRRYDDKLDDEGREFMRQIVDAAHRMDRMLSDLLTYSQQLQTAPKAHTNVDAEGALQGVLLSLDKEIREAGAVVTSDPLPQVTFDFSQLSQVFRQLLANALKFRRAEVPRIHISAQETEEGCRFSIRDNGLGIDPKYHQQVFLAFRRLHGREYSGTGVGLAICKRIIERAGGRIWVESEAGQGATFSFTLPA